MPLIHHAVGRGADGAPLFVDDADRADFLERLGVVAQRYGQRVLAYCLMTNHLHLLVEARGADLRVAGLCLTAVDWRRSSHPAMRGHAIAPDWLDLARLLELLGGTTRARYARYVAERGKRVKPLSAPWERTRP